MYITGTNYNSAFANLAGEIKQMQSGNSPKRYFETTPKCVFHIFGIGGSVERVIF